MLVAGGWHWGETLSANDVLYRRATTACLSAIVLMQIVNVQLCRSHRQSLVALPPFGNRLVVAGMLLEIVLITLIGYTAVGNRLFGTASISWRAWAIVLPFAIGMLAAEEARKAIVTWRSRAGQEDETRTPALPVAGGMQGQSH